MQTVLVVDDEWNIVELAPLYLSREGYKVLASGNGREVLEVVGEKRPDLVVLEITLPEMDGWEVCRPLRGRVMCQSSCSRLEARMWIG